MRLTVTYAFVLVVCCTLSGADLSGKTENALLAAYSDFRYAEAKRLAAKSDRPEFQLIGAMCNVFDRRAQNLQRGIPELERLSKSPDLPERYRCTAKLAYARAMHTLAMRKNMYKDADNVDPVPLYDEVIRSYPENIDCIYAVIYRTQYLLSKDRAKEALDFVERFIQSYGGKNKRLLCPLHLMLTNEYIRNGERYDIAVRHAEKARELVPANPKTQYILHFKIARFYDVYLKNRERAEQEYISYLKKHPDNSEAVLVRRYLKELRMRKAK